MSGRGFIAARIYGLFFQDLDNLYYLLVFFFSKFGWVANNTFFCGVTNSEHTCNIDFTLGMGIFGSFLFRSSIGFKNDYSGGGAWP